MGAASEIVDTDSLREWLETRPREDAIAIAHRAALRVLPLWGARMHEQWPWKRDLTSLPLLRCGLISAVAAVVPTADIKEVAAAAAYAAAATAAAAAYAADAAARTADAPAAAFWGQIRHDAGVLEAGHQPLHTPLWSGDEPDELQQADAEMQRIWAADPSQRWGFWQRWWAGAKSGQPIDPQLQLAILQGIDNDTWQDPDATAARIREIEDGFLKTSGEEVASDQGGETQSLDPQQLDAPSTSLTASTSHRQIIRVRAARGQVSALRDFLQSEFDYLRGQNSAPAGMEADHEAMMDALRDLRDIVDTMLHALDGEPDPSTALIAVDNALPAVAETAGALAVVEGEPKVSAVVSEMALTIKALTDAGAPGDLATKFAMGEVASKRLEQGIKSRRSWFFGKKRKNET